MASKIKPSVLVFVDWFYPGFLAGGPVQSIVSLVEYLHEDIDFWVVTRDRDLNAEKSYPQIKTNQWINSPLGCMVYYVSPDYLNKSFVSKILKQSNCKTVYINSLFSKYFSILPLLLLKWRYKKFKKVVAPRGMLGEGALEIKKGKKRLFLSYSKLIGLHSDVIWQATSSAECEEITRALGEVKIKVISNLPKAVKFDNHIKKEAGKINVHFSGRISLKKNILFALDVLELEKSISINLDIYGLIEDPKYWELCMQKINRLSSNISVSYRGTFQPQDAGKIISNYHLLFLPTLNENFGHSIVESLRCGCPVIISDQTPWNDLQEHGAGFALPLSNKKAFADAIEYYAAMTELEFEQARARAIQYIHKKIDLENTCQLYKELFHA